MSFNRNIYSDRDERDDIQPDTSSVLIVDLDSNVTVSTYMSQLRDLISKTPESQTMTILVISTKLYGFSYYWWSVFLTYLTGLMEESNVNVEILFRGYMHFGMLDIFKIPNLEIYVSESSHLVADRDSMLRFVVDNPQHIPVLKSTYKCTIYSLGNSTEHILATEVLNLLKYTFNTF